MRLSRVYCACALGPSRTQELPAETAHYLSRVLRLRSGDPLILFDGQGGEYSARLERTEKGRAWVRIGEFSDLDRESPLHIHIGLGLSRGERMDFAVQKCVELGVSAITPLRTRRSVVQLDERKADKRARHWRGIIQSACEQSGRNRLAELHPIRDLPAWCADEHAGVALLLDPASGGALRDLGRDDNRFTLLIGPEGGLEDDEISTAQAQGFQALRLGPRVLRTETAGVAVIAALQAMNGDFGGF